MSLFQVSVLKKHLKAQDQLPINEAWDKFKAHFHNPTIQANIRNSKEEQYQEGFLRDLFVDIFGYTLNPATDFNLTTELKNIKNAKKTDGAILQGENALAVIELKGTNTTDLAKVETQAFGYKNNQPTCIYVVTSNFEKLRFYIDNAVEFLEFNLFKLNREQFNLMWLCLAKSNLLNNVAKQIKDESLTHEEVITKKLYKDYTAFRNEVFTNIVQLNPEHNKLTLFQKTQKLLDRFLFIFFAEDRLLLPPNSIRAILKQWQQLKDLDAYIPLMERYQKYFGYLNTGHKGKEHEIFAYNGGLFAPDEIIDNLKIEDELLYQHTLKLSDYDFDSEVSVNVLGHIFENSLNEIEEIQAEIEGTAIDKSKSKRKKDGVFYTPKYITKYIVDNTVGKLCLEKKEALNIVEADYNKERKGRKKDTLKKLATQLETYRTWLLQLTICDPACGSGAFLNQALEFLMEEHAYIDELQTKLLGGGFVFPNVENYILENNLYGVDLNRESIEIAKLSLWLRTAQKGRKLTSLNNNIKCGNSLIDDPAIAGEKAFNWEKEFPQVFEKGGFDVIIGNPPYVRVQFLPYSEIDYYKEKKETAYKRVDISTLFFEESHHILKANGKLSFITSNQFQTTEYGEEIRRFISNKYRIEKILDFGDLPVFEGALTYVSIYSLSKRTPQDFMYKKVKSIEDAQIGNYKDFIQIRCENIDNRKWILVSSVELSLLKKLDKFENLGNKGNAWAGLFTGLDEILMFDHQEMENSEIEKELFLPIIRAADPIRNGMAKPSKYVIYPYTVEDDKTRVYNEEELKAKFPKGFDYLNKYKERLQSRKDSRRTFKDRNDWYALTRFGKKSIFNQSKIVSPGEVKEHKFSLDKSGSGFSCARVFAITIDESLPILGLLAILNSKVIKFFLQRKSSLKAGGYYSYSSKVLNDVPIPSNIHQNLIDLVERVMYLNKNYLKISENFQKYLQSQFKIEKLTKKLQNWHDLDFADFIKELNKAIKKVGGEKLSKLDEMDWMEVFETKKAEAQALKTEIDKTDREIDQMVYQLYGLTAEEIAIVEES